ncbi:hypothetical protein J1N35_011902 [Gossypium stocksii]|uniref:Uncharacterized protein n=1 Tax=Gossypium stocksii TaxID=47602 RepID=A0A9D4ADR5_9ROSI|nr:hypothetical protein J1N35_011902 [Gossypium stocksii]
MTKGVEDQIEPMGAHGKVRKASRSRDMLLTLENRVVNLEESMGDMRETLKVEVMQGMLSSTTDKLTVKDDALKAIVTTLKE